MLTEARFCEIVSAFTRISKIRVDFSLQFWSAKKATGLRKASKGGKAWLRQPLVHTLTNPRKRVAEDADAVIPESKKLKLETSISLNEPEEVPSASTSSAEPAIPAEDDEANMEDEPATEQSRAVPIAHTTKSKVADPSFREMPYTFLSPDDPALMTCM